MIKGIIFDVDGTILDSMHIWGELGKRYLESVGIKADSGLAEILFPMTLDESSEYLKNKYNLSDTVEKITDDTIAILNAFYKNEAMPKRGAIKFIKEMYKRKIPMAIATSGDIRILETTLKNLQISDCFNVVLTCSALNTSKRTPFIYEKAANALGINPSECLVFEDVTYAIESAKRGNFHTIAIKDKASINDWDKIKEISDYFMEDFCDDRLYGLFEKGE